MKVKDKYILLKKSDYKKIISYNFNESFNMNKKKDDERMGIIKFYDENIINGAIKRSIDNRFKKILELLANIEESDDDPSSSYIFCLDEMAKFKRELVNKYEKFLKKTQLEFINKKIELIEKDIKNKLIAYRLIHSPVFDNKTFDDEKQVEEKSRSR